MKESIKTNKEVLSRPFMKRRKIYVAGPMRGYKDFNFPLFKMVANVLRLAGHEVFNPAEKDNEKYGEEFNKCPTGDMDKALARGFSLREALDADLHWIAIHGDTICMLPGWEKSSGAKAEYWLAHALRHDIWLWNELREVPFNELQAEE